MTEPIRITEDENTPCPGCAKAGKPHDAQCKAARLAVRNGTMPGELRRQLERCRASGFITANGVVYDWELAGPNGASYQMFREPKHTDEVMEAAESHLRHAHDVVALSVVIVSAEELNTPLAPEPIKTRSIPEREQRRFHTILPRDVVAQSFYVDEKFCAEQGAFRSLGMSHVGRRVILVAPGHFHVETYQDYADRIAAFTEFPRGGDIVRLAAPWSFAGPTLKVGSIGFIDGEVDKEYLISVAITFNTVPFLDFRYCSSSGGPGSIATPISELKPTRERRAVRCWMWNDGRAAAHNGIEYIRTCRLWEWYPGESKLVRNL